MHVLFVCTGNICRSPIAERLSEAYAARQEITDFTASSAGTRAVVGHGIHRDAEFALQKSGGDASNFTARQLTPKIAAAADLVLTMTRSHRDIVLELAPRQLNRTFTLVEAARLILELNLENLTDLAAARPLLKEQDGLDVPDPIGQSREYFSIVSGQIAQALLPVVEFCRSGSGGAAD